MSTSTAYRSSILHFFDSPVHADEHQQAFAYYPDGILHVENGHIVQCDKAEKILTTLPDNTNIVSYPNSLITPGFIDTHIHYPQTGMVASYGEELLQWLDRYTFPNEEQFADKAHADRISEYFLTELLRCGTTTAMVFGTVHKQSVEAFFEAAEQRNLRMICGKVLMDRNAPDSLIDTAESGYIDSKALIDKWHKRGRLQYAVTPRFAPTSSAEQLSKAADLLQEYPDVYMHTHLSENKEEITWVQALFPESNNYLDVYDQHRLLGRRSVFAHGIHLCDSEYQRLAETDSALAFCPTSNLFLGSGLFKLNKAEQHQVKTGLGTDIGAGTSFSILHTLNEAYKVLKLQGETLTPLNSFYLATLGGARALDLQDHIGNFTHGKEADFIVLDYAATPLMELRMKTCKDLNERLFVLSILGDDRTIKSTYASGKLVHQRT